MLPGNRRVALTWPSSQYVAEVVRLKAASAQSVVYRGAGGRFVDRRLRNGRRYRYAVTLTDQAGQQRVGQGQRGADPLAAPASRRTAPSSRTAPELVWKPVRHARYYNAQLIFRGRKVLTRWPVTNRLQLDERWNSLGSSHRLARGRYCWYVWPGYGQRRVRNYGAVLGRSCFRITG